MNPRPVRQTRFGNVLHARQAGKWTGKRGSALRARHARMTATPDNLDRSSGLLLSSRRVPADAVGPTRGSAVLPLPLFLLPLTAPLLTPLLFLALLLLAVLADEVDQVL